MQFAEHQPAEASDPHLGPYRQRLAEVIERLTVAAGEQAPCEDELDRIYRRLAQDESRRLRDGLAGVEAAVARRQQLDAAPGPTIDVRDHGARGDGRHDDAPALADAIERLREAGPGATLLLPPGRYRLAGFADDRRRYACVLRDLQDVRIAGQDATLVGEEIGGVLLIHRCRNVRITGLTLDHDPLPMTGGTLRDVRQGEELPADLAVPDGFAALEATWTALPGCAALGEGLFAIEKGPRSGSLHDGLAIDTIGPRNGCRVAQVRPRPDGACDVLLLADDALAPARLEGLNLAIRSRGTPGSRCALWIDDCEHCDLHAIAVVASWHFAFMATHTTAATFRQCRVGPTLDDAGRPARLPAVNADGFHCKSNRLGPLLEQCEALGTPDDTSNIYTRAASLCEVREEDDAPLLVLDAGWDDDDRYADGSAGMDRWGWRPDHRSFAVGDLLALFDPFAGTIDAVVAIRELRPVTWRGHRLVGVVLDGALPDLRSRQSIGHTDILASDSWFLHHRVDQPAQIEHFVINLATKSDGFVIRESHFGRNSVAGIKMKASNSVIEHNTFLHHGWCGISLMNSMLWQEGFAPRHVTVCHNHFRNPFGVNAVCNLPTKVNRERPALIRDITIHHNRFEPGEAGWPTHLEDTRRVTEHDNITA